MEGDTLPTRYLRSRKRGRSSSPTKVNDGGLRISGLLRPRRTLGARGDGEEDMEEEMEERTRRGTRRRRRRRYASGVESAETRERSSSPAKESVKSCDIKRTMSDTSSSGENSGSVEMAIAPRRADLARFDAGNARQIAEAKAVLSPCASTPLSTSPTGFFGIRDEEARAVLRAVGAGDKCYVCGLPGTGKTHTMARLATKLAEGANMQVVSVNCMHLARCGNPDDELVYDALIDAVESGRPGNIGSVAATPFASNSNTTGGRSGGSSAPSASRSGVGVGGEVELRRILTRAPRRGHTISLDADGNIGTDGQSRVRVRQRGEGVVIMLDEMDALDPRSLAPLLSLPCAVIGIANSITLVERLAASGATGLGAKPVTVAFAPYTQANLARILDERLATLPFDLMHPAAVKLVTTRVAAHSGDVRRLLGAVNAAIDVTATSALDLGPDADTSGALSIAHMAKALHSLMANQTVKAIAALSTYQQITLCAGVRLGENATVGDLFSSCRALCESHLRVPRIEYAAFCSVLSTLSEMSMLRVLGPEVGVAASAGGGTKKRGPRRGFGGAKRAHAAPAADRSARVVLRVTRDDVRFALGDVSFFGALLHDE